MRRLFLAAIIVGTAYSAHAADMPDFLPPLRGGFTDNLTRGNWQGYYLGGQGAYGSSDENFTGSGTDLFSRLLSNTIIESEMGISKWPLQLGGVSSHSSGYGAFAGYNSQWDDVVVGLEASYLHGKFGGASTGSERRIQILSDGYSHDVTASYTGSISIQDYTTLRIRAGYSTGSFLPYAFAGVALGFGDISRAVSVRDIPTYATVPAPPVLLPPYSPTDAQVQHNRLLTGYTAGVGVDMTLVGGLFARAEYEYARFNTSVSTNISTARLGLGYKF